MKKILIVDDNEPAANSLVKLLRLLGHESRAAYEGMKAVSIAVDWQPDLVILDLMMPKVDGFEVLSQLRSQSSTSGAKIVALTGVGPQLMDMAKFAGFDMYLEKPATAEQLSRILAEPMLH